MINNNYIVAGLLCLTLIPTAPVRADELDSDIPMVLTPVRLKQPRTEVPASVTVLDRQFIKATGIRELAQLFRYVPGMAVGARDGWNYTVSYHGTGYRDSRRMQVLVDGRSVYQAGLATIDWNDIPLAIEDIERIEVVRGPNTAAYGANAFLGVINIITRHPDDSPTLRLKATGGTESVEDYYGSTAGKVGDASYRISAGERRDAGFDERQDGSERRDSKNLQHIEGQVALNPSDSWALKFFAGYKNGVYLDDYREPTSFVDSLPPLIWLTPPDIHTKDYFVSIDSEHFLSGNDSITWQFDFSRQREKVEWVNSLPAAFLGFTNDFDVVHVDANENIQNERIDLDIQHTLVGQAPWKLVYGLHTKLAEVDSQTYFNGHVQRETYQLFANAEYRFLPQWSITLGGSQEYQSSQDENFSPRVAMLFSPTDNHTLRTSWSTAVRTPDLLETDADWSYTVNNIRYPNGAPYASPTGKFLLSAQAPDGLHEEEIESLEAGYYGLWLDRRLEIDLKWFWDHLDELMSRNITISSFPINNGWLDQQGYEAELKFQATPALQLRATYAMINSESNQLDEMELTPHHSGSASIIYQIAGWQFSSFYYKASTINYRRFEQIDLRIAKAFTVSASEVELSATAQRLSHYKTGDLFSDNRYDDPYRFLFAIDLHF